MRLVTPLLVLAAIAGSVPLQSPVAPAAAARLHSTVIDWRELAAVPTPTGERRIAFDAPTATLDRLHGHITTLNPGQNTGALHRHPQEELILVREGTLEVNIDGRRQVASPGALIFFAVNENENLTNIGTTPATYVVLQWYTPLTPKE